MFLDIHTLNGDEHSSLVWLPPTQAPTEDRREGDNQDKPESNSTDNATNQRCFVIAI